MKKIHLFILSILCSMSFLSCEKHEDLLSYDRIRVGSVLLSDGRVTTPENYNSKTMEATGIIYYLEGTNAWVVSMYDCGEAQFLDTLVDVTDISTSLTAKDGLSNTASLIYQSNNSGGAFEVPAARTAAEYDAGMNSWFLPSVAELVLLGKNKTTVENSLVMAGGEGFTSDQYSSSTQDGTGDDTEKLYHYTVSLKNQYVTSNLKLEKHRVRPILIINTDALQYSE